MSGLIAYVGIVIAFSVVAIGLYYGFRALKLIQSKVFHKVDSWMILLIFCDNPS